MDEKVIKNGPRWMQVVRLPIRAFLHETMFGFLLLGVTAVANKLYFLMEAFPSPRDPAPQIYETVKWTQSWPHFRRKKPRPRQCEHKTDYILKDCTILLHPRTTIPPQPTQTRYPVTAATTPQTPTPKSSTTQNKHTQVPTTRTLTHSTLHPTRITAPTARQTNRVRWRRQIAPMRIRRRRRRGCMSARLESGETGEGFGEYLEV